MAYTQPLKARRYSDHTKAVKEKSAKAYNDKRWKIARDTHLRREPLCEIHKAFGMYRSASEVHHIETVVTKIERAYDQTNLVSVCPSCHRRLIHSGKLNVYRNPITNELTVTKTDKFTNRDELLLV